LKAVKVVRVDFTDNIACVICYWAGLDTNGTAQILGLGNGKVKIGIVSITIIDTADFAILIITTSNQVGVTLGEGVTSNGNHTSEEGNEE
jgi:hypothetical protein